VISPGRHRRDEPHDRNPAKMDRWLVGLLAGAALMYLAGKVMGLGKVPIPARASLDVDS
jgi:hypothetical protein